MKLQTLFQACNWIIQSRLRKNPDAKIQIEDGEALTYKELSDQLQNLESWCYQGELDVQKIVRCKNCKHYKRYRKKVLKNPYEHNVITACDFDKSQRSPEYFCCQGEERDK